MTAELRQFERWCEGVPEPVILMAKTFALNIGPLYERLISVGNGMVEEWSSDHVAAREWLRFYRKPKTLYRQIFDASFGPSGMERMQYAIDSLAESSQSQFENHGDFNLDKAIQSNPEADRFLLELNSNKNEFHGNGISDKTDIQSTDPEFPAMLFMIHIWIPCWLIHHQTPVAIYRKACSGDINALESLIRIDKTIIQDDWLGGRWRNENRKPNSPNAKFLQKALSGFPLKGLTTARIKIFAASLVTLTAKTCRYHISTEKVADLFHAAAIDLEGKPYDDEIESFQNESFRKRIRREEKRIAEIAFPT